MVTELEVNAIISWDQITLKKAIELSKIEIPKELFDVYTAENDNIRNKLIDSLSDDCLFKAFPDYYGKVLSCLYNIPEETMKYVHRDLRKTYYEALCMDWILGVRFGDYRFVNNIKSFEFKGVKYFLPETEIILNGIELPFRWLTTLEFTEAADIEINSNMLRSGNYEYAANVISILCKPKGEKYNEKISMERAELFQELTMDIVWEVFFYIQDFSTNLKSLSLTCSVLQLVKELKNLNQVDSDGEEKYMKLHKMESLTKQD